MRLTLRTLLAYLDDTLDAAQVKQIGQKVAESDTAQELIARIKQVTRRRRLTTPPENGPGGKIDANAIAEYLDNTLSEDKVAEVEQTCLGSDVHLAEMAACHQILTLILGEPILIPPTSRQRMYGLVKGREAIPFRKPPAEDEEVSQPREDSNVQEMDETLRMGLPALRPRSSWKSRLPVIGGALAAAAILTLAIFQALHQPGGTENNNGGSGPVVSQSSKDGEGGEAKNIPATEKSSETAVPKTAPPSKSKPASPTTGTKQPAQEHPKHEAEKDKGDGAAPSRQPPRQEPEMPETPEEKPAPPKIKPKPAVEKEPEPAEKPIPVAEYMMRQTETGRLLQFAPADKSWHRVDSLRPEVTTGSPLVALPGFQGTIKSSDNNLRLKLWGVLPEQVFFPTPVRESIVELHPADEAELDLTLHRGRIILSHYQNEPARVRIRVDNPTNPELKVIWDLTLLEKGTDVFIEKWTKFEPGEPFYPKQDNPNRVGPQASLHLLVRKGKVQLRQDNKTLDLQAPPKECYVKWDSSAKGLQGPVASPDIPSWALDTPQVPSELDKDAREKLFTQRTAVDNARDKLATLLSSQSTKPAIALLEGLKSKEALVRILVVQSYGALDDLSRLVDALSSDKADVRHAALETLHSWITYKRDNDYKLFADLHRAYSDIEARTIVSLLHDFSREDACRKETYSELVKMLTNSQLAIRELAYMQLVFGLQKYFPEPVGLDIRYAPEAPVMEQQLAQQAWNRLIAQGKLPPQLQPSLPVGQ